LRGEGFFGDSNAAAPMAAAGMNMDIVRKMTRYNHSCSIVLPVNLVIQCRQILSYLPFDATKSNLL